MLVLIVRLVVVETCIEFGNLLLTRKVAISTHCALRLLLRQWDMMLLVRLLAESLLAICEIAII